MFQKKIDKIFEELLNAFGIADDILIEGYDDSGTDQDRAVCRVVQTCRKEKPKLKTDKCHFRSTSVPFLKKVIARCGILPEP